jgi:hypothetical protein
MTVQALPKTNELIDEINSYVTQKRRPTDWQIKLLKKKADGLKGKIPENLYYDVLGRMSCLENDIEALNRYYQIALTLASTDFQTQFHYLISLRNKGLYSKALAHGKTLLTHFPEHSETILSELVGCAVLACRIYEAFGFLTYTNNPDNHECYQLIKEGRAIFETAELTDDEAEHLQNLAHALIQKNNLYFSCTKRNITRGCIHYQIYVDLPIEEIFEINWQLADVLVENSENTHSDAILFEYESVDVLEESLA